MKVTNIYLSRHEDVKELAERIGKDIGSLEHLTTEDKKNIVAAINELKSIMSNVEGNLGDYATKQELTQAIADLINGADADADTLKELADKITALAQADNGLVSAEAAQSFDEAQKKQARDNIGAVSEADLAELQLGLTKEQLRSILEKYIDIPDQGPISKYYGTGWYKDTDTGTVYNVGVPEGETYIFEGDPTEYISVYTKDDARLYAERAATSNITDMSSMFRGRDRYSPDISHWDTSNVTDMSYMFSNADDFHTDISSWNTSNVTDMSSMFEGARAFNQDISSWDTSNVTDMSNMFERARAFNQDLSLWCVRKIESTPTSFDNNATNWTLPKPVWGTCPRGEDEA